MARNVSRRTLFSGTLTAGLAAGAAAQSARGQAPARQQKADLPDVWGQDFVNQWSPPATVKRDLTPGTSHIRLSSPHITSKEGTDYGTLFKSTRARVYATDPSYAHLAEAIAGQGNVTEAIAAASQKPGVAV